MRTPCGTMEGTYTFVRMVTKMAEEVVAEEGAEEEEGAAAEEDTTLTVAGKGADAMAE